MGLIVIFLAFLGIKKRTPLILNEKNPLQKFYRSREKDSAKITFNQSLKPLINIMEATPRFELGVKDLQSSALPLGYVALLIFLERKTGFEPATFALARQRSTAEPLPHDIK